MKKVTKYTVVLILIISIMAITLTACVGSDGLSAYEIAVKNGYTGSETEWLESLKGTDGADGANGMDGQNGEIKILNSLYAEARQNDYDGTFFEFVQEYIQSKADATTISTASTQSLVSVASVASYVTTRTQTGYSYGSAVLYKDDVENSTLYLITNYHVIYNASGIPKISNNISIYLYGSEVSAKAMTAKFVGGILEEDIAVLAITGDDYHNIYKASISEPAVIADSDTVRAGDTSLAVGNASGEGISVTAGIVSVDSETITLTGADDTTTISPRVIRTDSAVNPGNSGGGLFNGKGQLIGIVNAKIVSSTEESMGYAIPSNVATSIADNLIELYQTNGNTTVQSITKPVLGITIAITNSKAQYNSSTLKTDIIQQITVQEVTSGSAAEGKLQAGDVLTSVNGENVIPITRNYVIPDLLWHYNQGEIMTLVVIRDGAEVTVDITLSNVTTYTLFQ